MRQDWEVKKLGDVCQIIGGGTPSKAKINFYNGNIPWATVRDMKWDIITETECTITEEGLKNSSTNIIPKNNVVIATRVGLGKVCLLKKDTAINQDLKGIIPLFSSELSVNYLYWWFKRISNTMIKNGKGATVQGVNVTFVKNLEIPIPTLTEQERIVEILDEALTGIATIKANTERNLKNARELFQSYLQSIFSNPGDDWEIKQIKDIGKTQYGISKTMNEEGKGFKIFRMGEIQERTLIDTGTMKYVDIDEKEFKKYKLYMNDVVFNRTNSYELVGKTGIFCLEGDYCFASYLVRINSDKKIILPKFLNYLMNSNNFQYQIKQKASKSINQANINATILSNETICFPSSLKYQQKIVEKLDALSAETKKLETIYQQKLNDLEELKKSLLQKAFNGELTNPEKS